MRETNSIQSWRYGSCGGAGQALSLPKKRFPALEQAQRTMLVVVLSTVWLLASRHSILNEARPGFARQNGLPAWTRVQGKQRPPGHVCALPSAARRINRRFGSRPDSDSPPPHLLVSPMLLSAEGSSTLVPPPLAPPGLVECWRFDWRTALDPRAPSIIADRWTSPA
jgi:hypothetical protein